MRSRPVPSTRPANRRRFASTAAAAAAVILATSGCSSSSDDASGPASSPASAAADPSSDPVATAAGAPDATTPAGSETSAAASDSPATVDPTGSVAEPPATTVGGATTAGDPGPICDSIPGLEEISAIVGEPLTTIDDYSSPTVALPEGLAISQRCEVTGDGFGTATFDRLDATSGAGLVAEVTDQGLVRPIERPDLPGVVAWANSMLIEHAGLYWQVSVITLDTVGQQDAPAAYQQSGDLLAAWIGIS